MSLRTYRWQIANQQMASVAGRTTGAGAREALARALTTQLADDTLVGDAMSASPELLPLAPEGHTPEVALKHQRIYIVLVQMNLADAHDTCVTRDARPGCR